ncbi:MAG: hypothetical protein COB04_15195 [Gammaproteobacteria bacterium]|nr:MAG: hypothetical protein COB04_15195 [Gammaproteobacteria bacterium]
MSYLIASILLVSILLANVVFVVWSCLEFKKDWPIISDAWGKTEAFEKRLLYMGLSLFVFIPALKEHPASSWYISKVIIEILPAMAGSLFVAGILAFMRQVHEARLEINA